MRRARHFLGLLALPLLASATEPPTPPPLQSPQVLKLSWNTRCLISGDFNNDGRLDLAVADNDLGRIALLLQRDPDATAPPARRHTRANRWEPLLEDAPFTRDDLPLSSAIHAIATADLDNDGLTDLIALTQDKPLRVFYQLSEGGFSEPITRDDFEPLAWPSSLCLARLHPDAPPSILILTKQNILIFDTTPDRQLTEPTRIPIAEESPFGLTIADVNGDGLPDILYLAGRRGRCLRLRLQQPQHQGFGPELAYEMELRSDTLLPIPNPSLPQTTFAAITERTQRIELFHFAERPAASLTFSDIQPQIRHTPSTPTTPASYALGHFQEADTLTLAVADPRNANIWLHRHDGRWNLRSPQAYPTLAGVSHIAPCRLTSEPPHALAIFSERERMLGLSISEPNGRLSFPRLLNFDGDPHAFAAADMTGDGKDELVVLLEKDKQGHLLILAPEPDASYRTLGKLTLDKTRRLPESIQLLDLNHNGTPEILLLIPREPARLFVFNADQTLAEIATDSAIRRTLLNNLTPDRIGYGDTNQDGQRELLVGAEGFIRTLVLDAHNILTIQDQFNTRSGDDDPRIPLLIASPQGRPELLTYVPRNNSLQALRPDHEGILRYAAAATPGTLDPTGAALLSTPDIPGTSHILLYGKDRFWLLPLAAPTLTRHTLSTYETDLETVTHNLVVANPTKTALELTAIDGKNNLVELLSWAPPDTWHSLMHFPVFEQNLHYEGRQGSPREPREALHADLSGNGQADLILLVHDRLLYYPRAQPPTP